MMPLEAGMEAMTVAVLLIITFPSFLLTVMFPPFTWLNVWPSCIISVFKVPTYTWYCKISCSIGWCKHGKRTGIRYNIYKLGLFDRSNQSSMVFGTRCYFHHIFRGLIILYARLPCDKCVFIRWCCLGLFGLTIT